MTTNDFISYAQNAEDVVLWRVFGSLPGGVYVDVGAADPVVDSVTYAFYERGWRGVNVEPVPSLAAALRQARPDDQTFQVAAGREAGTVRLFVSDGTGRSTVMPDVASATAADGYEVVEQTTEVRTLDHILRDAGMAGRAIQFCKIDVEGAEPDVLAGLDLTTWRPWVLVVEATAPQSTVASHRTWEAGVLQSGYSFSLFDGLNRFYVADEHRELAAQLSYPACVFDQPYTRADVALELEHLRDDVHDVKQRLHDAQHDTVLHQQLDAAGRKELNATKDRLAHVRRDALAWRDATMASAEEVADLKQVSQRLYEEAQAAETRADAAERLLDETYRTLSWRLTLPLRAVRRVQLGSVPQASEASSREIADDVDDVLTPPSTEGSATFLAARLWQAVELLDGEIDADPVAGRMAGAALVSFENALEASPASASAKAWLAMVATLAKYPVDAEVEQAGRLLRAEGASALIAEMRRRFVGALNSGQCLDRDLHVVRDGVVVDVSHTVSHDLHTGIQRVVRETVSRWVADHETTLVNFDMAQGYAKALDPSETTRIRRWRDHLHRSGSDQARREPSELSSAVVVPWRSRLLLPELVAEPVRCEAYRALARSGVLSGLGLIGYDLIPITATETVAHGMSDNFTNYLSVAKHATQLSAISEATAHDFTAFGHMLASQGLPGPDVVAHQLPSGQPPRNDDDLDKIRDRLHLGSMPLVLAVGSHEPRKNHLAVLEAASALWRSGEYFHLLMIGGSGWRAAEFDRYVDLLQRDGHPLTVWRRASEEDLWAAYHLARFSVFPSLVEGYGLPIAESLACGTPVITSSFGSMAEVAAFGGAVTIDPRDVHALETSMRALLVDEDLVAGLRKETLTIDWGSWDEYARRVWDHLNGAVVS